MSRNSRPAIPVAATLMISPEGDVVWTINVIGRQRQEADGTTISRGRILWSGKIQPEELPLTEQGVSGLPGKVLPRGRLPAMFKTVNALEALDKSKAVETKDALCWAVLRRYATEKACLPDPSDTVRRQAWEVIQRACKRANVETWLRQLPAGFWTDPVPTDEALWPVAKKIILTLGNREIGRGKVMMGIGMVRPLGDLLNPDSDRKQSHGSADILPTNS